MPVGVVHTALDDGHFGRKTAEKQWGRRGVGTVVGHLQNRQGTGIRTVSHVLLLVRLGVASEQDAGCAIGQQDGHRVVVDLGEQTAFCVRRRSYDVCIECWQKERKEIERELHPRSSDTAYNDRSWQGKGKESDEDSNRVKEAAQREHQECPLQAPRS